ncbi:MAG: chorismate synthase [Crocinitomicaceae bacterium]
MAGSSFGHSYRLSTFGESHGIAIGGIIDGVPAGQEIDIALIQAELDRRKPGQSAITTQRRESDTVEILSGIYEGRTTGTPIGFIIRNSDSKSKDYDHLKDNFRPSHADFTYQKKYGHRDHRGGGRSSARETACRVVAGAVAKQILESKGISFLTYVDQVGNIKFEGEPNPNEIETNEVRCPSNAMAEKMMEYIKEIRKSGDTVGGAIKCIVNGLPIGLGEPVFDKLHAVLGHAVLSINAVKGVEFGSGFEAIEKLGSEHNDLFNEDGTTKTNNAGGIVGGISNGMPLKLRVAFKPVATLLKSQESIDKEGNKVTLEGKGRHDPCVVPRAVPIVESMVAITLLDMLLQHNATRI